MPLVLPVYLSIRKMPASALVCSAVSAGIPGVIRVEFAGRGPAPPNLSRPAADSGTVTSALVPWNRCGAFMGAVLGASTLSYPPCAIFDHAGPALSFLHGITGFEIEKADPVEADPGTPAH
ncbi:Na+/H+ antiporter NhaC family protein [Streptomyces sp. NPDC058409]|uniref:Na+/H+ antiporter NhaC family protein n=1 Tax=Streptomyces sp. NPDC058409 TaxID=3346484 RepID=UPI00365B434F